MADRKWPPFKEGVPGSFGKRGQSLFDDGRSSAKISKKTENPTWKPFGKSNLFQHYGREHRYDRLNETIDLHWWLDADFLCMQALDSHSIRRRNIFEEIGERRLVPHFLRSLQEYYASSSDPKYQSTRAIGDAILATLPREFTVQCIWKGICYGCGKVIDSIQAMLELFGEPTEEDTQCINDCMVMIFLFVCGGLSKDRLIQSVTRVREKRLFATRSTDWHLCDPAIMDTESLFPNINIKSEFGSLAIWEFALCRFLDSKYDRSLRQLCKILNQEFCCRYEENFTSASRFWCFYFSDDFLSCLPPQYVTVVIARAKWIMRLPYARFWVGFKPSCYQYQDNDASDRRSWNQNISKHDWVIFFPVAGLYSQMLMETTGKPLCPRFEETQYMLESFMTSRSSMARSAYDPLFSDEPLENDFSETSPLRCAINRDTNSNLYHPMQFEPIKDAYWRCINFIKAPSDIDRRQEILVCVPIRNDILAWYGGFRHRNKNNAIVWQHFRIAFSESWALLNMSAEDLDIHPDSTELKAHPLCRLAIRSVDDPCTFLGSLAMHLEVALVIDGMLPFEQSRWKQWLQYLKPAWVPSILKMCRPSLPAICDTPDTLVAWCRCKFETSSPERWWLSNRAPQIATQQNPANGWAMDRFLPYGDGIGTRHCTHARFAWEKSGETLLALFLSCIVGLGGSATKDGIDCIVPQEIRNLLAVVFFYCFKRTGISMEWRVESI